jgi:hypothetical protein
VEDLEFLSFWIIADNNFYSVFLSKPDFLAFKKRMEEKMEGHSDFQLQLDCTGSRDKLGL